jgi:hypothetical protein
MFDLVVAERPDHCGGKTEVGLQHEALGSMTSA